MERTYSNVSKKKKTQTILIYTSKPMDYNFRQTKTFDTFLITIKILSNKQV